MIKNLVSTETYCTRPFRGKRSDCTVITTNTLIAEKLCETFWPSLAVVKQDAKQYERKKAMDPAQTTQPKPKHHTSS